MRGLTLRATLLQNFQVVKENRWSVPNHIHDHEDHLFFLVRDLSEIEGGQVQLIVGLEHVLEGGQRVHDVPVVVLRVLVYLHSGRTASHFAYFLSVVKVEEFGRNSWLASGCCSQTPF